MLRIAVALSAIFVFCAPRTVGQTTSRGSGTTSGRPGIRVQHEGIVLLGIPEPATSAAAWLQKQSFDKPAPFVMPAVGSLPEMAWKTHRPPSLNVQRRPTEIAPLLAEIQWLDSTDERRPEFAIDARSSSPVSVSVAFRAKSHTTHRELVANREVPFVHEPPEEQITVPENSPPTVPVATLNLTVLRDRIQNHNVRVSNIERQLREQEYWDVANLRTQVGEIGQAMRERNVWRLYYEGLDLFQKRKLEPPHTLTQTWELLRQRIFEAEVELDIDDSLSDERRQQETAWLRALDERVKSWLRDL